MAKVKFTREFFNEFQKNPNGTAQKYGFDTSADKEFFSQDFKNMSYDDFEKLIKKSRFFNYFDWS